MLTRSGQQHIKDNNNIGVDPDNKSSIYVVMNLGRVLGDDMARTIVSTPQSLRDSSSYHEEHPGGRWPEEFENSESQ